jgi:hypothetical protein
VTDSGWLGLVELLLVLGGVLAFGAWELISLRRDRSSDKKRSAHDRFADDCDHRTD